MKNKNNSGFTLIEMLVTLTIVAALSIVIGIGATSVLQSSYKTDYAETYKELFKNANIYVEYSTSTCNIDASKTCSVTLADLVRSGLLDKKYYNMPNPYKKSGNFVASDTIIVTLSGGRKTAKYFNTACGEVNSNNVNDFDRWGEC